MLLRSRILGLVGVGVLVFGGTMVAQAVKKTASTASHTVAGKITSMQILPKGTSYASVACEQIKVKAEIWSDKAEIWSYIDEVGRMLGMDIETSKEVFASTTAKGAQLKDGCTYSLTFNYDPSRQLPESSQYRVSAVAPQISEGETAGYTAKIQRPFADQVDMEF
jgi:hypothetical protein